jgi:hypothetical protein
MQKRMFNGNAKLGTINRTAHSSLWHLASFTCVRSKSVFETEYISGALLPTGRSFHARRIPYVGHHCQQYEGKKKTDKIPKMLTALVESLIEAGNTYMTSNA